MGRTYGEVCPVARTLDLVGERWTLLILRELFLGATRHRDLARGCPGIPARMLSERLKLLERERLIERRIYSEHPLRAEYLLTCHGRTLRPVLDSLFRWGMEYRLDRRERARVIRHLYGNRVRADAPPAALRLPSSRGAGATSRPAAR